VFTRKRDKNHTATANDKDNCRSLLHLGRAGADREEWIKEAIRQLKVEEGIARVGVWLEMVSGAEDAGVGRVVFRGEVWDEDIGPGPPEWSRVTGDAPLLMELLNSGKSCEYELEGLSAGVIFGPLMGMQRVQWVPVIARRTLRGLVMLGSRQRQKLPSAMAFRVADELGMLLDVAEAHRLAEIRKMDLELYRRVETMLLDGQDHNRILDELAESCTRGDSLGDAIAVFALIGERSGLSGALPTQAGQDEQLLIRAQQGDDTWSHAVNQGPLESLWRKAVANGRLTGAEAGRLPLAKQISRIVAIPLQRGNSILGVLLAGLPRRGASLEHLERLETRALLASEVLEQEKRLESSQQRVMGIMHELSNPLTTILGSAQRIILRNEVSERMEEAHRILAETERATAILQQLLYLSRDTRPKRRLLSLNDLVRRTADLQRNALAGGSIRLQVEAEERLPSVEGDAGQLQQVLLNLIQNAQQAIEQSGQGSAIWVRTSSELPGRVQFEVRDDGPGIPETIQARIFDPFFTTKPPGVGTGLGLAIVSGFVRQHGGTVSVLCPAEGGTRFVVDLPSVDAADGLKKLEGSASKQGQAASVSSSGGEKDSAGSNTKIPHVLVVEDEPTVANLISDVLRDEGIQADVLPDGRAALDAAQKKAYDLAICDLKMPGVDGQAFYKALVQRKNPLCEHILFVTGDVLAHRTQEFLERHHLPHVAKPFRVEELSLAVRRMLWGRLHAAVS
jgi:signal transduction histidine kinase/CheY-like chemotaxis protein